MSGHETPAGASADDSRATPAGATSSEGFRTAWRKARAERGKARRRAAGRYIRLADRAAGERYRPGMTRRPPPDGGDAA